MQKSEWFMLQRIRKCFGIDDDTQLSNKVEVDETYVGSKNKNRHPNKKFKIHKEEARKIKTPVVGMIERGGKVTARAVKNVKSATLIAEIIRRVKESATLYSDEWLGYKGISRIYDHSIVKYNQGQYINGRVHTNIIEGFGALLKRGIFGIYHVSLLKNTCKRMLMNLCLNIIRGNILKVIDLIYS